MLNKTNCSCIEEFESILTFIIQRPSRMVNIGGQYKDVIIFSYLPHKVPSRPVHFGEKSIKLCRVFTRLCIVETSISTSTRENWFSKYCNIVVFLKLKIFIVLQYRHIIHQFEDEAL